MSFCLDEFYIKYYNIKTLISNYTPINDDCVYQKLDKSTNKLIKHNCGTGFLTTISFNVILNKLRTALSPEILQIEDKNETIFLHRIFAYLNDIISDIFCFCKCELHPSYLLLELLEPNAKLFIIYKKSDNKPYGFSIINEVDFKTINDIYIKYFNTFLKLYHHKYDIDIIYKLSPFLSSTGFNKEDIDYILKYTDFQKRNLYINEILKKINQKYNFYVIEIFCSNAPYKGGQCLFELVYKYLNYVSLSKMGNVMLVHEPIQSAFEYYTNVMKYNSNDFILFDKDNKSSKLRYIFNIISINKLDNKKIYYDDVNEYNKIDIDSIMRYPIRQKRIQYVDDELEKKYNKLSKMIKKSKINNTLNDAKLYDLLNSGISLEYILNFLKEKGKGEKEKK
jgi:hypothetical protein